MIVASRSDMVFYIRLSITVVIVIYPAKFPPMVTASPKSQLRNHRDFSIKIR
jgi:hypothetical protein